MLHEVMATYVKEREEVTKNFASIYVQCVRIAEQVGTVPEAPRVTKRKQHRTNPEASSVEYYKRAVVIPFINHIIQSLEDRFSPCSLIASSFLGMICTIPVTSCECERSASCLRCLNNYMRASMGKSRLSSLALLHIYYDHEVDLDEVVDCYARLHP